MAGQGAVAGDPSQTCNCGPATGISEVADGRLGSRFLARCRGARLAQRGSSEDDGGLIGYQDTLKPIQDRDWGNNMTVLYLLLAAAVTPPGGLPPSGDYGNLKLAFSDGRVTGEFYDHRSGNGTDQAPQFSCGFALVGTWKPGTTEAAVQTWWPNEDTPDTRVRGRLTMDGATATLSLDENPGGCEMTGDEFKEQPFSDNLSATREWLEVREVRSQRAHFSDVPGDPPRRNYVTRGDIVGVIGRKGAFVHVEYVGGNRPVTGWFRAADLAPLIPTTP